MLKSAQRFRGLVLVLLLALGSGQGVAQSGGSCAASPPTGVMLSVTPTSITQGGAVTVNWSSSNAQSCFAVGPAGVTGWTGSGLAPSGARAVTLSQAGTYTFQMYCFNSAGVSNTVSSAAVTVSPSGGGDGYCAEYYNGSTRPVPTDVRFTAHGFTRVQASFETVWGGIPGTTSGINANVPGNFLTPYTSRYLAIPITLIDEIGSGSQINFSWVETLGIGGIQTGPVVVTISPCAGDFRPPQVGTTDPYLGFQCRVSSLTISGNMSITSVVGLSGCPAPKNKQIYMNIAPASMYDTTAPTTSTCPPGAAACGVRMRTL
ncbi:MAG: hypothetical protein WCZ65_08975 [Lysobacteraceae bacterium]